MCGIGGLILTPPGTIKDEWLLVFLEQLEHRGPDDSGWLSLNRGRIRLGHDVQQDLIVEHLLLHRRLSILDFSSAGHQPMGTPDGRYWIVFNAAKSITMWSFVRNFAFSGMNPVSFRY